MHEINIFYNDKNAINKKKRTMNKEYYCTLFFYFLYFYKNLEQQRHLSQMSARPFETSASPLPIAGSSDSP